MTSAQLIDEGRKLQRPCVFLRPQVNGPVAAMWHGSDADDNCWLTVDARQIPGPGQSVVGYVSVYADENSEGGRVEVSPSWPKSAGTALYAHRTTVLPPLDAVFAYGSDLVAEWLSSNGWERTERFNSNFRDSPVAEEYEDVFQREFPIYFHSDIYAILGGWHLPMPDDDWYDLVDEHLMVFTLRESEPWVEAWQLRSGQFKVIQRIT